MIVTEMYNGQGLGNQIWCILATRIVAEKNGYSWGVNRNKGFKGDTFLKNFDLGTPVVDGISPEGGPPIELPNNIINYYKEPIVRYPSWMGGEDASPADSAFWNTLSDQTKIDGNFQKTKYIKDRRLDIAKWLKPELKVEDYSDENICVINFRGNDYFSTTSWLPPEYYHFAMQKMLEINKEMKFVIVTDDPNGAERVIGNGEIVGVFFDLPRDSSQIIQEKVAVDYSIIFNAKNIILSSSTFGFWPAWINTEAKVFAPKYWFDYKISDGWWRPDDSIVEDWIYVDREGKLSNGVECLLEYEKYKLSNPFYSTIKAV
jgi:hypothetical protein